jgi:phage terminase large subunit-like protein
MPPQKTFDFTKILTKDQLDAYSLLYSRAQERAKQANESPNYEAPRLFMQARFMESFPAFVFMLGYQDTGAFHEKEMNALNEFRLIDPSPKRLLYLWSRGFFKTSIINVAHNMWYLVNNPNARILIVSFTLEVAKKCVGEMRDHFVSNKTFRYFFREYCPKVNTVGKVEFGSNEQFTIPKRTRILKEPSVMCAGVGTNITGFHFDLITVDDLVNKDSVTNDTQIQQSKDYYSSLRQLYDNPSVPREKVIGTIYHFNDLHINLLNNIEFTKSVVPVHDSAGNYLFPERINEQAFTAIKADQSMSPYDVASQYLLKPFNPKDAVFQEAWWGKNVYRQLPEGLAQYICCDPASTLKKKSDYTVMQRWGIDSLGQHYLLEGIRDKLEVAQRIDKLFDMIGRSSNLKWVTWEVTGGRQGDLETIKIEQRKRNKFFMVKEAKTASKDKIDRVRNRLQAPWSQGVFFFPEVLYFRSEYDGKTYDFVQLYKLEFLQFPFCEHDDLLDAHSQMFEEASSLVRGKKAIVVQEKKPMTYADEDKWYNEAKKTMTRFPGFSLVDAIRYRAFKRLKLR